MEDIIDRPSKPVSQERFQNSGGILAMGILSIVFGFGLIGLILGIVTLSISSKHMTAYRMDPMRYDEQSFKQVKAGRTCAIVGLSLFGLAILIAVMILSVAG